jgi:hypothetical protein
MKYLYKILRLFFCPHKYQDVKIGLIGDEGVTIGTFYDKKCRYCGHMKRFNLIAEG